MAIFFILTDILDQHDKGTNPHFTFFSVQRALKLVSDVVVTVHTSYAITFTCWVSSIIEKFATFVSNSFHFIAQVKKHPSKIKQQIFYPMSFNITNTVMLGVFLQQVGSVCSIPPLTNYVDTGICKISEEPHQCFEPLTATCPLRNFQPSPEMVVHLFQLLPVFKDSILPSSITEKSSLDSSNNNALLPPVGSVRPFQIETVPLIIMLIINPLIYFIIALMQMILGRFLRVLCCIRIHHWMSQTPSQSESAASQESLNLQMLHHLLLRLRYILLHSGGGGGGGGGGYF